MATSKATTSKATSAPADKAATSKRAPRKAATSATSKGKAATSKGKGTPADKGAATPKRTVPAAPAGWQAGYSNTGFVRYARRLRNGQPTTAYRTAAATTPADKALVAQWAKAGHVGAFVLVNHATGSVQAFGAWAPCYAASMAMQQGADKLAPSVVASLGKAGTAAVTG